MFEAQFCYKLFKSLEIKVQVIVTNNFFLSFDKSITTKQAKKLFKISKIMIMTLCYETP